MARAYLKILLDTNQEDRVLNELLEIEGITQADLTTGEQDIIAIVEADSYDDIVQIVLGQVRRVPGIARTVSSLAVSWGS